MKDHPGTELRALKPGDDPDLWKSLNVMGTPTILLEQVGTGRSTVLRGLAPEAKLRSALAEVSKEMSHGK